MSSKKMDWLKELSEEELQNMLYGDLRLIYSYCGIDTLIKLCENMMGLELYISSKPIKKAMDYYIVKNFTGANHKELALKLRVGQRYIYEVLGRYRNDRDKN